MSSYDFRGLQTIFWKEFEKVLGLSDQQNASSHNDGWDGWHDRTFFTTKQLHRGKIRILVIIGKFETKHGY